MLNIGILGFGTVGEGIKEILDARREEIEDITGEKVNIKKVMVKNIDKDRNIEKNLLTTDFSQILNDDDIKIVIEVTSDLEESYENIKKAIKNKKHVITANKAIVSKYFEELKELSRENGVEFLYEASVAGGIPIIKPLKDQVNINEIHEIQGILNGTCNYILTNMFENSLDYQYVLKRAQELGYAEADPSADVEGYDTLRKLRILATIAYGTRVGEEDILLEGINKISKLDVETIKAMNSTVKLIGESKIEDSEIKSFILPTIVKNDSYFATVNQAMNSVAFRGDMVGELKFYGPGAGKLPTASAILVDLVDILEGKYRRSRRPRKIPLVNSKGVKENFYIRMNKKVKLDSNIVEKDLSNQDNTLLVTKKINIEEVYKIIRENNIGSQDYFLARFLD